MSLESNDLSKDNLNTSGKSINNLVKDNNRTYNDINNLDKAKNIQANNNLVKENNKTANNKSNVMNEKNEVMN